MANPKLTAPDDKALSKYAEKYGDSELVEAMNSLAGKGVEYGKKEFVERLDKLAHYIPFYTTADNLGLMKETRETIITAAGEYGAKTLEYLQEDDDVSEALSDAEKWIASFSEQLATILQGIFQTDSIKLSEVIATQDATAIAKQTLWFAKEAQVDFEKLGDITEAVLKDSLTDTGAYLSDLKTEAGALIAGVFTSDDVNAGEIKAADIASEIHKASYGLFYERYAAEYKEGKTSPVEIEGALSDAREAALNAANEYSGVQLIQNEKGKTSYIPVEHEGQATGMFGYLAARFDDIDNNQNLDKPRAVKFGALTAAEPQEPKEAIKQEVQNIAKNYVEIAAMNAAPTETPIYDISDSTEMLPPASGGEKPLTPEQIEPKSY